MTSGCTKLSVASSNRVTCWQHPLPTRRPGHRL